jgi:hypothetical protein
MSIGGKEATYQNIKSIMEKRTSVTGHKDNKI